MIQNSYHCPTSKHPLLIADAALVDSFNACVEKSQLTFQNGSRVTHTLQELLIEPEAQIVYPVQNGIPRLLPQLAVSLELLNLGKSRKYR